MHSDTGTHLRGRAPVALGNLCHHGVLQRLSLLLGVAAKGRVRHAGDALAEQHAHHLALRQQRVQLDLCVVGVGGVLVTRVHERSIQRVPTARLPRRPLSHTTNEQIACTIVGLHTWFTSGLCFAALSTSSTCATLKLETPRAFTRPSSTSASRPRLSWLKEQDDDRKMNRVQCMVRMSQSYSKSDCRSKAAAGSTHAAPHTAAAHQVSMIEMSSGL